MNPRPLAALPEPYARPDLYDVLFGGLVHDLPFWLRIAREAEAPTLDLACGTGRVLLPLLDAGVDADGVELHPGMLARARSGAVAKGFRPGLYTADMRDFATPRRYGCVVLPFNAFAHNLTPEDQAATLRRCHDHLVPGGTLAFDAFTATPAMLAQAGEPELEMEAAHPDDGHPVQCWDARAFDLAARTQHSRIEVRELNHDRTTRISHRFETFVRWVDPAEIAALLRGAGFARHEIWSGYESQPVTPESNWLVIQAWRD